MLTAHPDCRTIMQVNYADGDQAWLYMGIERMRLLQPAGHELPPPTPQQFAQLADVYRKQVPLEQRRQQQKQKVGEQ